MVENLIPRRQLRSKRDQYRRKLAIKSKKVHCSWYFLQRRALKKQNIAIDDQTAQIWWEILSRDPNSGAHKTNDDGH